MALWVNAIFGQPMTVEMDLLAILQGDLGLGDQLVIVDPTVVQMTYFQSITGFAQNRLSALINTAFPNEIVVTGVDSTYGYLQGPFWVSITKTGGGVTVVKKSGPNCSGSTPQYTNERINVGCDTSECGGDGYWVRDGTNNKVVEPRTVILFHELAHAFHWASRNTTFCATGEIEAVDDENGIRKQFSLPQRSFKNLQGGCGAPAPYNPWEGIGCFIVTAVTGSPRSLQVLEFHRIRDGLLRPTRLGRKLFDALFAEYYQCAPRIVADMQRAPELKLLMTQLVVEPLLDVLLLTERHVRQDLRCGALDAEVDQLFDQARIRLAELDVAPDALKGLVDQVFEFEARLQGKLDSGQSPAPIMGWLPETVFPYLAQIVPATTPETAALAWGVAQPLAIYWVAIDRLFDGEEAISSLRDGLADAIEDWLALAPVDWWHSDGALAADLQALGAAVMTSRDVRHRFGAKLLARCHEEFSVGLVEALHAADFIMSGNDGEGGPNA